MGTDNANNTAKTGTLLTVGPTPWARAICPFGTHLCDVLVDTACPTDVLFAPAVNRRDRAHPSLLNQRRSPHGLFGCCLAPTLSRLFGCPNEGLVWSYVCRHREQGARVTLLCSLENRGAHEMSFRSDRRCIQRTAKLPGAHLRRFGLLRISTTCVEVSAGHGRTAVVETTTRGERCPVPYHK